MITLRIMDLSSLMTRNTMMIALRKVEMKKEEEENKKIDTSTSQTLSR